MPLDILKKISLDSNGIRNDERRSADFSIMTRPACVFFSYMPQPTQRATREPSHRQHFSASPRIFSYKGAKKDWKPVVQGENMGSYVFPLMLPLAFHRLFQENLLEFRDFDRRFGRVLEIANVSVVCAFCNRSLHRFPKSFYISLSATVCYEQTLAASAAYLSHCIFGTVQIQRPGVSRLTCFLAFSNTPDVLSLYPYTSTRLWLHSGVTYSWDFSQSGPWHRRDVRECMKHIHRT